MSEDVKVPEKQSVHPDKAAKILRLKQDLKSFASAKAGGITGVCQIDASSRLAQVLESVKQASGALDLSVANRVHGLIVRVITKPPFGKGLTITVEPKTIETVRRVLTETTRNLKFSLGARGTKGRTHVENFSKRCTTTLCQCCEMAIEPVSWKHALMYARDSASIVGVSLEPFLSENTLGQTYLKIEAGVIEALRRSLVAGDMPTLDELAELYGQHHELEAKATDALKQLFSDQASTLPSSSQQWAMSKLGLNRPRAGIEYSDPADSPEVKQAATLLMFLFDRQNSSEEFGEAFERFRSLSELHFHLFLRGDVGAATEYNARIHESPEGNSGKLRLVRPWVEFYSPPNARIVIRGIVER